MAEAEAIAAVVLRKLDPSAKSQTGPKQARQLNTQRPPANNSGTTTAASTGSSPTTSPASASTGSTGQRVRVANTGGTGVRLRVDPSKTARVAGVLPDGTMLDIVGPDKQAEGLTWRNVRAPGDGRGWVASDYVVAVAGSSTSNSATQANAAPAASPSPTPSPATASAPATTTTAGSTTTSPPASPTTSAPPASTSGDVLKVDVNVKNAKVKAGGDQSVDVVVTKNGQPLSGAQVTVKTSPTGETPSAGATDASGKVSVSWKPTGSPGFIGVGVSALGTDGSAGVGGASFEITN
jgi:hypothetical protein